MICKDCINNEEEKDGTFKCKAQPCYPTPFKPREGFKCGFHNKPNPVATPFFPSDPRDLKIQELERRITQLEKKLK